MNLPAGPHVEGGRARRLGLLGGAGRQAQQGGGHQRGPQRPPAPPAGRRHLAKEARPTAGGRGQGGPRPLGGRLGGHLGCGQRVNPLGAAPRRGARGHGGACETRGRGDSSFLSGQRPCGRGEAVGLSGEPSVQAAGPHSSRPARPGPRSPRQGPAHACGTDPAAVGHPRGSGKPGGAGNVRSVPVTEV